MRKAIGFTTLPLILAGALAGCSLPAEPQDNLEEVTLADSQLNDAYTYFAITADVRRCAFPTCGGWFLSRVNKTTTQCHDGRYASSCYTPVLDWSQAFLSAEQQGQLLEACSRDTASGGVYGVVRGSFARTNSTTPRPGMGRFVISEAWITDADALSDGVFVKIRDNGLRCFTSPCPSLTETTLNNSRVTDIAAIDFAPSGMSDDEIAELMQTTTTPDGVMVAGYRYTVRENGATALGRTATTGYYCLTPTLPPE
jgi:hypothetical protein